MARELYAGIQPSSGRDVATAIEAWKDRYVSTVGMAKYRRAAGWALDETAKHAVLEIRRGWTSTLKKQGNWTRSAVRYNRSMKAGLNAIESGSVGAWDTSGDAMYASVYVIPKASTYLKYLFGMSDNIRLPGDVGLAQRKILIPWWQNITHTQGVRPNRWGGVPTGFLARLVRESEGDKVKSSGRADSRWGVYYGEIGLHGSRFEGFIARPPRKPVDGTRQLILTRSGDLRYVGRKVVPITHPRILFLAVDRARYKPILEKPWRDACASAAARIPDVMAAQLADNVAHLAKKTQGMRMAA